MRKSPRFQFSVGDLLALSTLIALTFGIGAGLGLGFTPLEIRIFLLVYIFVGGAWAILRGPAVYGNLCEIRRRQKELAAKRQALVEEVQRRRATAEVHAQERNVVESEPLCG